MAETAELFFSQAALGTFQACPLRFRYRYIDDLYWSRLWGTDPADRAAAERGQAFHLLARRYYAGVDPGLPMSELAVDPTQPSEGAGQPGEFARWLQALQDFLPRRSGRAYYPELELRLDRPGLRLMARFDLLVVEPDGRAVIYDWKTEGRTPRRPYLRHSLQTVLYRYLLCAAGGAYSPGGAGFSPGGSSFSPGGDGFSPGGGFAPERVAMVYWFAQRPERWERFDYSPAQFAADERFLRELIAQILRTSRGQFVATSEERVCHTCEYQGICHGRRAEHVELDEEEWLHEATLVWDDLPPLPG